MPALSRVIGARRAKEILRDARDYLSEMGVVTVAAFVDYRLFLDCHLIFAIKIEPRLDRNRTT